MKIIHNPNADLDRHITMDLTVGELLTITAGVGACTDVEVLHLLKERFNINDIPVDTSYLYDELLTSGYRVSGIERKFYD